MYLISTLYFTFYLYHVLVDQWTLWAQECHQQAAAYFVVIKVSVLACTFCVKVSGLLEGEQFLWKSDSAVSLVTEGQYSWCHIVSVHHLSLCASGKASQENWAVLKITLQNKIDENFSSFTVVHLCASYCFSRVVYFLAWQLDGVVHKSMILSSSKQFIFKVTEEVYYSKFK